MLVGLTYDLRDEHPPYMNAPSDYNTEFESPETVAALEAAITSQGHTVQKIGNVYKLVKFLAAGNRVDIVFNMAEGLWNRSREAQVPALLEAYQIPYTGSDPLTLALGLDKGMTKTFWLANGLATPPFWVVNAIEDLEQLNFYHTSHRQSPLGFEEERQKPDFGYPLFVKPLHEGSSKGITKDSIVTTEEALYRRVAWMLKWYQQPAIIEAYLPGREFTVGILGTGENARVVGVGEVLLATIDGVHGLEQKEGWHGRVQEKLKGVEFPLRGQLANLALKAYNVLSCRDAGRVDMRVDGGGHPYLLEINPIAGLHPRHSSLPILAKQAGLSFNELITEILQGAIDRISLKE
ncbi:MAG: D-alanine--D-alanine ligase [Anaerolineae bacterium]|nr:D-alanine--D-alanine ligase [Anaerolineae bacterium]